MPNRFIARKQAVQPLGRRALMRRLRPSVRQKRRIVDTLKDEAAALIRKGLNERLAESSAAEPLD